jgi:aspartate-semialdehyde dehydrogenase
MQPYQVGILGATGVVGQRLVQRLAAHPWFRIAALAASDRSAGLGYAEAVRWRLSPDPPPEIASQRVRSCDPDQLADCDLVFSALDSSVARELEPRLAAAGLAVISNSSAYRGQADVPLLVPEINGSHLELLAAQRERNGGGYIVTNPNCSVTGLVLALAPLHRAFGLRRLIVATLQAVSGAGAVGPQALDMLGNVLPHIPGEEEKFDPEVRKILGELHSGSIRAADLRVSAHCHRVPVLDGHFEAVSVELARPADPLEAAGVMARWGGDLAGLGLPSAPAAPIVVRGEADRPQPLLDRDSGGGMTVVVGRVRPCPVLGLKFVLLSHNAVRGAAGGTVLNAEFLAARDFLPRRSSG